MAESKRNLTFAHVNCQDLKAGTHFVDFQQLFKQKYADIICVAESWLSADICDSMYSLPGYNIFRRDRARGCGGGVIIYVEKSLKARVIASSIDGGRDNIDFLLLEVCCGQGEKILLAAVYRPPKIGGLNEFFNHIIEAYPRYSRLVILGDFNSNMLGRYHDSEVINNFVQVNNLFLVPTGPTFRGGNSNSLIDLCIIDEEENMVEIEQGPTSFSGHDYIRITYRLQIKSKCNRERLARDFRNFVPEALLHDLSNYDWREFYALARVDNKVEFLNKALTECFDTHAPVRRLKYRHQPVTPWLTGEIREKMRERDRARRAHRNSPDNDELKAEKLRVFKELRNCVKLKVRDAKRKFYGDELSRVKGGRSAWDRLRQLRLLKSAASNHELVVPIEEEDFNETNKNRAPGYISTSASSLQLLAAIVLFSGNLETSAY